MHVGAYSFPDTTQIAWIGRITCPFLEVRKDPVPLFCPRGCSLCSKHRPKCMDRITCQFIEVRTDRVAPAVCSMIDRRVGGG